MVVCLLQHHGPGYDAGGAGPAVCQGLNAAGEALHQAGPQGVPEDLHGHSYWLCHHGLHWILCQTDSYSHQQHHCVSICASLPNVWHFYEDFCKHEYHEIYLSTFHIWSILMGMISHFYTISAISLVLRLHAVLYVRLHAVRYKLLKSLNELPWRDKPQPATTKAGRMAAWSCLLSLSLPSSVMWIHLYFVDWWDEQEKES